MQSWIIFLLIFFLKRIWLLARIVVTSCLFEKYLPHHLLHENIVLSISMTEVTKRTIRVELMLCKGEKAIHVYQNK